MMLAVCRLAFSEHQFAIAEDSAPIDPLPSRTSPEARHDSATIDLPPPAPGHRYRCDEAGDDRADHHPFDHAATSPLSELLAARTMGPDGFDPRSRHLSRSPPVLPHYRLALRTGMMREMGGTVCMSSIALWIGFAGLCFDLAGFIAVWEHVQRLNKQVANGPRMAFGELEQKFRVQIGIVARQGPRGYVAPPQDLETYLEHQEQHQARRSQQATRAAMTTADALLNALVEMAASERQAKADANVSYGREWTGAALVLVGTVLQAISLFLPA